MALAWILRSQSLCETMTTGHLIKPCGFFRHLQCYPHYGIPIDYSTMSAVWRQLNVWFLFMSLFLVRFKLNRYIWRENMVYSLLGTSCSDLYVDRVASDNVCSSINCSTLFAYAAQKSGEWQVILVYTRLNHTGVCFPSYDYDIKSTLSPVVTTVYAAVSYGIMWCLS